VDSGHSFQGQLQKDYSWISRVY